MNLTFTKNLPTVAPKSLTVFNQSYTGEEKIIYRATREELKNLVESGLAVHVSKRKRKPISKSSLPPFPGSHPSPWSLGPGRNNEGGKTHTTNPLSPYPRPPIWESHWSGVTWWLTSQLGAWKIGASYPRPLGARALLSHFQLIFLLEDSHPFKSEWLSSSGVSDWHINLPMPKWHP